MPEVNQLEFDAVVTDIHQEQRIVVGHRWRISLDRTQFSPQQAVGVLEVTARSGAKLEIPVLGVVEVDGEVWHLVEKPLGVGTQVRGRIR